MRGSLGVDAPGLSLFVDGGKNMQDITVVFEESADRSAAYDGGNQIGECDFTVSGGTWTITHTGVRPEYGGRGIARRLVEKVIEEARARRMKIVPVCSYAVKVMESGGEYGDVL